MDTETIKTLLELLNPLHGELDRQTYDQKVRDNFDAPADSEYNVDITARMERDLSQAVAILEDRLRQAERLAADDRHCREVFAENVKYGGMP